MATFYHGFHTEPRGEHTCTVCMGTACHVRGAPRLLEQIERDTGVAAGGTTPDLSLNVEEVSCVGACAIGPLVIVDGDIHGHMTPDDLSRMVTQAPRQGGAGMTTLLADAGALARHRETLAPPRPRPGSRRRVRRHRLPGERGDQGVRGPAGRGGGARRRPRGRGARHRLPGVLPGRPAAAPAAPEGIVYQHVRVEDVAEIVEKTVLGGEVVERLLYVDPATDRRCTREEEIPFYRHQQRVLLRDNGLLDPTSIDAYIALGGYSALARALEMGPEAVLEEVKRSGLRGRGGAGFPTGRKWEACRKAEGELKYVVCNADEGDPGAFMDDALLEGNPHSVLEGMIIGAYAMGAREGHVYVRQEYPVAVERITRAIEQARELGLLGEAILGSEL